jgi:hypothetical protein
MNHTPILSKCGTYLLERETSYKIRANTPMGRRFLASGELLEAGKAILAKESELRTRHAWLEYRALETAIAKAEGR